MFLSLIKAGIDSFKIEGRARSPDYGAMVTNVYRQAIDKYYENLRSTSKSSMDRRA